MKYDLVKHFYNEVPKKTMKVINSLKTFFAGLTDLINANIEIVSEPKITVFGIVTESRIAKYLKIGISRCSSNDTFSRKQGREYAKWRAINSPLLRVKMESTATDDEIQDLFFATSIAMNRKFKGFNNVHLLAKIPDELKNKFIVKPIIRRKWSEQEIAEAKMNHTIFDEPYQPVIRNFSPD